MKKSFLLLQVIIVLFVLIGCGEEEFTREDLELYNSERIFEPDDSEEYFTEHTLMSGNYFVVKNYAKEFIIYNVDNPDYKRVIGSDNPGESRLEKANVYGDYLVISTDWNSVNNYIYVYKFSDESYERVIEPTLAESQNYFGGNVITTDSYFIVHTRLAFGQGIDYSIDGTLHIYAYDDLDYERIIIGQGLGGGRASDVKTSGDYIVFSNSYLPKTSIYKFSDEEYERFISDVDDDFRLAENFEIQGDFLIHETKRILSFPEDDAKTVDDAICVLKLSDPNYKRVIYESIEQDEQSDFESIGQLIVAQDNWFIFADNFNNKVYVYKLDDSDYRRIIEVENTVNEVFINNDYFMIKYKSLDAQAYKFYVLKLNDSTYRRTISYNQNTNDDSDIFFGKTLTLYEDYLFVGAPGFMPKDRGFINVYKFSDSDYKMRIDSLEVNRRFGGNIIVNEENILVGPYLSGPIETNIYIYSMDELS